MEKKGAISRAGEVLAEELLAEYLRFSSPTEEDFIGLGSAEPFILVGILVCWNFGTNFMEIVILLKFKFYGE